jgi:hypothetical protein
MNDEEQPYSYIYIYISSTPPYTNSEADLLPYQVTVSETETSNSKLKPSWIQEAAQMLRRNGVCTLVLLTTMTLSNNNNNSLIPHSDCDCANEAAASRLSQLQRFGGAGLGMAPFDFDLG